MKSLQRGLSRKRFKRRKTNQKCLLLHPYVISLMAMVAWLFMSTLVQATRDNTCQSKSLRNVFRIKIFRVLMGITSAFSACSRANSSRASSSTMAEYSMLKVACAKLDSGNHSRLKNKSSTAKIGGISIKGQFPGASGPNTNLMAPRIRASRKEFTWAAASVILTASNKFKRAASLHMSQESSQRCPSGSSFRITVAAYD